MPTVEGQPPRAIVAEMIAVAEDGLVAVNGQEVKWSRDVGTWVANNGVVDVPVPQEAADAITERAKELGVDW